MSDKLPPLPDDAIEIVRQAVGDESNAVFLVGDTVNALAEEMPYPKGAIIARLAFECGLSAETIRDYAWVAGRVSPAARDTYPLTRHQWKACLSAGDDFLTVADWAVNEYPDKVGGRPASVKAIRAHVADDGGFDVVSWWARRTQSLLESGIADDRLPDWVRGLYRRWVAEFTEIQASQRGRKAPAQADRSHR